MDGSKCLTKEDIETARRMRKEGFTLDKIAARFGCSRETIRTSIDDELRRKKNAVNQKRQREIHNGAKPHRVIPGKGNKQKELDEQAAILQAQIPPDTRDFTARLMGDPLPGRRALDKV